MNKTDKVRFETWNLNNNAPFGLFPVLRVKIVGDTYYVDGDVIGVSTLMKNYERVG